jgi:hypothetical protein
MNYRVNSIRGDFPVLIIVPHGPNDKNTTIIGERIISELNCYGVINYGWERDINFDYYKDKANCNSINHIENEVICDEFLNKIITLKNEIKQKNPYAYIFLIHGVKNRNDFDNLNVILGNGSNEKNATCPKWMSNLFASQLLNHNLVPALGIKKYSGSNHDNLNQIFNTKKYFDENSFSFQIEILFKNRKDKNTSIYTGDLLAMSIEDLILEIDLRPDYWINYEFNNFKTI